MIIEFNKKRFARKIRRYASHIGNHYYDWGYGGRDAWHEIFRPIEILIRNNLRESIRFLIRIRLENDN